MSNFLLQKVSEVYEEEGTYFIYMNDVSESFPVQDLSTEFYKIPSLDEQREVLKSFLAEFPDRTISEAVASEILFETFDEEFISNFSDIIPII